LSCWAALCCSVGATRGSGASDGNSPGVSPEPMADSRSVRMWSSRASKRPNASRGCTSAHCSVTADRFSMSCRCCSSISEDAPVARPRLSDPDRRARSNCSATSPRRSVSVWTSWSFSWSCRRIFSWERLVSVTSMMQTSQGAGVDSPDDQSQNLPAEEPLKHSTPKHSSSRSTRPATLKT